jgi:DNA-binding NarL/FixJ family response regulator
MIQAIPINQSTLSPPVRVLIVDDYPTLRHALGAMLRSHEGIEVVAEAADGVAGVVAALEHNPDVVLMDYTMPRMNGAEATRRIVDRLPGVRVIGLSMHTDPAVAKAMTNAGASTFITKDRGAAALIDAIREASAGCE